jgi:hypothetical protein
MRDEQSHLASTAEMPGEKAVISSSIGAFAMDAPRGWHLGQRAAAGSASQSRPAPQV